MRGPLLSAVLVLATPSIAFSLDWACGEADLPDVACGLVTCEDGDLTSSDALSILRSAVGREYCSPCRCDSDGSGKVVASDALRVLLSAVGSEIQLSCPACSRLAIVTGEEAVATGVHADAISATGDGGVTLATLEGTTVVARRFDPSLSLAGEPRDVVTLGHVPLGVLLCARADGSLAVAWDERVEFNEPPPHDYEDTSNVRYARLDADGAATGALDAHAPVNGSQGVRGILCRPEGEIAIAWVSMSIGIRAINAGGLTSFPAPRSPLNGLYLSRFDASDLAIVQSKILVRNYASWFWEWTPIVEARPYGFLSSSYNRILTVDAAGDVLAQQAILTDDFFGNLRIDCHAKAGRCVAVSNQTYGNAIVFDPLSQGYLGATLRSTERTYEPPSDFVTGPHNTQISCDEAGVCIGSWDLVREEEGDSPEDPVADPEYLGTFGRALNLFTGEMGAEVSLASTHLVNVGPGSFVSVETSQDGKALLRSIHVE